MNDLPSKQKLKERREKRKTGREGEKGGTKERRFSLLEETWCTKYTESKKRLVKSWKILVGKDEFQSAPESNVT